MNRRKTLPYSQECMSLFLPAHQIQLQERALIPTMTPLLPPQKQSNVARQTTLLAISPRILEIEGEIELMLQEGSLTASLLGNSSRGKKQTLHTNNDCETMRISFFFIGYVYWWWGLNFLHVWHDTTAWFWCCYEQESRRVKNSLCKESVEHWNFFQCIGVHVTAILNLSMLRNTRNKTACLHIARPYFFCHSPGTLSNCFVIITHDTCPRYHLQRLIDTSHMDYILGFGPLPTGLQKNVAERRNVPLKVWMNVGRSPVWYKFTNFDFN